MKRFRSLFGGHRHPCGRYPDSLIAAIEHAVDATDPRLRLLSGYRQRLRAPVAHALDYVVTLVDSIPPPLAVGRHEYSAEPSLSAVFASSADMLDQFARDGALEEAKRAIPDGLGARITALLLAERVEKNILGMDLVDGVVRREVAQIAVSFTGHRLLGPSHSERETRHQLKRWTFDHLLSLALTRLNEVRVARADLARQRRLLRRKIDAMQRRGRGSEQADAMRPDPSPLLAEMEGLNQRLGRLGVDDGVLKAHLELVADVLGQAEHQIWNQSVTLHLDSMNIRRPRQNPSGRQIVLQEFQNARGRRSVMLLVSLAPGELPPRENFAAATQHYSL